MLDKWSVQLNGRTNICQYMCSQSNKKKHISNIIEVFMEAKCAESERRSSWVCGDRELCEWERTFPESPPRRWHRTRKQQKGNTSSSSQSVSPKRITQYLMWIWHLLCNCVYWYQLMKGNSEKFAAIMEYL